MVDDQRDTTADSFGCCGVRIAAVGISGAVSMLEDGVRDGRGYGVHLCNAYTLSIASGSEDFRNLLNDGINFADGVPITVVGRIRQRLGKSDGPVRGPSLMESVLDRGLLAGRRHYFYGGSRDVLDTLLDRLLVRYPGLEIVGAESPPFRELRDSEHEAAIRRIQKAAADYVWIGLGTPKQDHFVHRLATAGVDVVAIGVGAAFDFHAGSVKEAPLYLQGSGFEWVYRLVQEPRRLLSRYTIGSLRFLVGLYRHRVGDKAMSS